MKKKKKKCSPVNIVINIFNSNNLQPGQSGAWRDGQAGQRASAPAAGIPGRARGAPARRGQTRQDTPGVATAGARHRQVDD
jgi:hypothetical protein